jgi:hypothetical protein
MQHLSKLGALENIIIIIIIMCGNENVVKARLLSSASLSALLLWQK